MNRFIRTVSALLLVLFLAVQGPARAFAQAADAPDYISEVKIAMGDKAEKDLEGYTILKDEKGKAVDLNQDAGGSWGSQGIKRSSWATRPQKTGMMPSRTWSDSMSLEKTETSAPKNLKLLL